MKGEFWNSLGLMSVCLELPRRTGLSLHPDFSCYEMYGCDQVTSLTLSFFFYSFC